MFRGKGVRQETAPGSSRRLSCQGCRTSYTTLCRAKIARNDEAKTGETGALQSFRVCEPAEDFLYGSAKVVGLTTPFLCHDNAD